MKYLITRYGEFVEIPESEYEMVKNARNNLFQLMFLEEKFDYITENYFELENEILSIATRMMIFTNLDYFSMSDERNKIGRRIVNFLTVCRMYRDSSSHHLKNIYPDDPKKIKIIEDEKSKQYDSRIGYRAMEEIRNYVQHKGFPIQNMIISYKTVGSEEKTKLSHNAIPMIRLSTLKEDKEIKKDILNDLKSLEIKGEIDIRLLIRDYVEGISEVHKKIRELLSEDLISWEKILNKTYKKLDLKYKGNNSFKLYDLRIEDEKGHKIDQISIFPEFLKQIHDYFDKNNLTNIQKCFVTNEIK